MSMKMWMPAVTLVGLVAGCASYPKPDARLAQSQASIGVAQGIGASGNAQATDYLTRATEELNKAKSMMNDGNNEEADYMLMRADADAKLATELSQEQKAETTAQQAASQAQAVQVKAATTP
jgi:hypothetical protein